MAGPQGEFKRLRRWAADAAGEGVLFCRPVCLPAPVTRSVWIAAGEDARRTREGRGKVKTERFVAGVTVLLVVLLAGFVSAGGPPPVPPGLERAAAAQEAHTDALLARPGVVGTAVGLGADGRPVVKIYTKSAGVHGLPDQVDGVPVEVEAIGEIVAQLTRPSPTGVSSGTERLIIKGPWLYCTVGTLGARVKAGNDVYALSNAHVYALEGSEPYGDVDVGNDRILQPGRADMAGCGTQQQINEAVIGTLAAYVPIVFSTDANNQVDAAIALTSESMVGTATPAGYTPSSTTVPTATLGLAVQKYGRTTKLTKGTVTGVNATVIVSYDTGQARFVNQIVITGSGRGKSKQFSGSGDSGSLIVTQTGYFPVALLFAGSSSSTIGNPIDLVLQALGVTIDDGTP